MSEFSAADLLVDREAYRVCRLMPQREFISYCRDRNIGVSDERLRKLERLKLFYPILRIYRFDVVHKVEFLEGRQYRDLGPLHDNEIWSGDTRTELARFGFGKRVIRSWREHGNAWDPRSDISPHAETIDSEPRRHEAFYSQFQIFELDRLVKSLTVTVEVEWALKNDSTIDATWGESLKKNLSAIAQDIARFAPSPTEPTFGIICQIISDRYYPRTQSDERRILVSDGGLEFRDWDWYEYARSWDALAVAELIGLERNSLRSRYEHIARACRFLDPLENWHELIRFVAVEKRRKLKGDALKAQAIGEMVKMLRLFYFDAFEEELKPPNELGRTPIHRVPDVVAEDDPLRALELVANDFGVNPKPQAVLFIEGETEMEVVPFIFDEMFATNPSIFGIELVNLRGISNATGGRDSSLSALWRLVDYLHHHQTISFVVLDNEGLAHRNVGIGLPSAHSIHFSDRLATRKNYVKLWKLSFEMDNFNDAELARAMSEYSHGKAKFSSADVRQCRESAKAAKKNTKIRTLQVLYTERTGQPFRKPQFGRRLMQVMFDPATKRKPKNRPIVRFLDRLAELAARNHQPVTQAMWEYNQRSGYFGTMRPGSVARRKDPFGQPAKGRPKTKSGSEPVS